MSGVSVLILTLNEEVNLAECIASCGWSDDIVVFDSFSTDRTCEIAARCGARVVQRSFDNYAAQRNAALNEVVYKNAWVLMLDADERVSPELAAEITDAVAAAPAELAMFRIRRKDYFMGRWLQHSSGYPTWFGRLVRVGRVHVHREINEEYQAAGQVAHLQTHLLHLPFNRGVHYWYERHNRYSSMEASTKLSQHSEISQLKGVFSRDPVNRRRALKQLAYRLPFRPVLAFAYLYLLRLGFLDGIAGLRFCAMRMCYEFMIDLKVAELRRRARGLPV